jgi:Tol biopolymer transport system component
VISGRGWGRRRAGLVVPMAGLVGLVAIALQGPSPASAASACPGRNGQVAVSVGTRSGSEVLGVVTSGRRVRRLFGSRHVPQEAIIGSPSYSCDGAELVYSVDNESGCDYLEVVAVATRKRRQLETPHLCDDNPAFLADGRIVFDARHGTYVVDADGGRLTRLFGGEVSANTADGRWFIADDHQTICLLDSKGRRVRRLAPVLPAHDGEYLRPRFSPDGNWIVYEKAPRVSTENRDADLFVVRRDDTHRRRLTANHQSSEPVFSPDGRWIAFIRSGGRGARNVYELLVSHPDTVRALTHVRGANFYEPTWAAR